MGGVLGEVSLLTPRVCARLRCAGGYKINGPLNQALFGFGDAVCVPVIQWIARHYLNPVLTEMQKTLPPLPTVQPKNVRYSISRRTSITKK